MQNVLRLRASLYLRTPENARVVGLSRAWRRVFADGFRACPHAESLSSDTWREPNLVPDHEWPVIPESPVRPHTDFLVVDGGPAMLISDLEVHEHHAQNIQLMLAMAMQENIKTLIIVGDGMASDPFALWPKPKRDERDDSFASQLRLFVRILYALFDWFDHIVFVSGNHDRRIGLRTNGEITLDDILDLLEIAGTKGDKILDVTEYNYVYKHAPEFLKGTERYVPWLMSHPMKGSGGKMAGGLGQKLYEVERLPASLREVYGDIKPHIIEPHTHKWGVTLTTDAARQILAIGASRDPERTRYKQDKSTYGNWALGFGMIDSDGYGYAWNYEHTNWRRVLHPNYHAAIPEELYKPGRK